jgi:hypothetical protein
MQKIVRGVPVEFGPVVWLAPEQIDDTYFNLLPAKASEITIEEIAELSAAFGEGGEMQAERLS